MSDAFEDHPDWLEPRRRLLDLIVHTPHLDWLLLTKRPENVNHMIELATGFSASHMWFHAAPNVWIGTSVEDQKRADERIPHLLNVPATVRFLSAEPLLGPIDLGDYMYFCPTCDEALSSPGKPSVCGRDDCVNSYINDGIHWVIVGGESGHHARAMHPHWALDLRDQCRDAGIAFHFKQWGEWVLKGSTDADRTDFGVLTERGSWMPKTTGWNGRPIDPGTHEAYMIRVGKKAAGRVLDGRTWDEYPTERDRA